jgi:glycyl-tRNA synthetase
MTVKPKQVSTSLNDIISLAKRRGFIYPSSEIYGGFSSVYDYGPLGVELKNNIKKLWWQEMVYQHDNIFGLDSAIFMHSKTWTASGHTDSFSDPLVECKRCHHRFRADHLLTKVCPDCGGELTKPKDFNLLVKAFLGTTEDNKSMVYLRGETCQGIYLNYRNVLNSTKAKVPFGIAQIGKAFRNEITTKAFTFRTREFEQMEMQYFIEPEAKKAQEIFEYWKAQRLNWYLKLGINKANLRFRDHTTDERAHYAKAATDIEYHSSLGWKEFEGIHHRGDWDLSRHSRFSGQDLTYFEALTKKRFIPWIIETSAGADRATLFFLMDAFHQQDNRIVLQLHPLLAPFKAAVFPLLKNKPELVKIAREIYTDLRKDLVVDWDERGNIGKRYLAQDEIGTPWCVTVDFQTLTDKTVTIRNRDTTKQVRIEIDRLKDFLQKKQMTN